jgi:hypothetical protein
MQRFVDNSAIQFIKNVIVNEPVLATRSLIKPPLTQDCTTSFAGYAIVFKNPGALRCLVACSNA